MAWGDVKLEQEADGTEYLEYTERQTKTRMGADPRNVRPIKPKVFATNGTCERDPVAIYKIYAARRPSAMNRANSPFYLGINHTKDPLSKKTWFKLSAMGVNKLNSPVINGITVRLVFENYPLLWELMRYLMQRPCSQERSVM